MGAAGWFSGYAGFGVQKPSSNLSFTALVYVNGCVSVWVGGYELGDGSVKDGSETVGKTRCVTGTTGMRLFVVRRYLKDVYRVCANG